MSDIELLSRSSRFSWFNSARGEISVMELSLRYSRVSWSNPANGEISDTELLLTRRCAVFSSVPRSSLVRLVACSSPVKLVMLALLALSSVNLVISSTVMVVPGALPRFSSMTPRRLGSGISTVCAVTVAEIER